MPEIIIEDKPELRGAVRTAFEWTFTSLMWALWLYLFLPLLTIILWAAGLRYFHQSLFGTATLASLVSMLVRMGWAVVIIFVLLRGWGAYNYWVFGRRNRRKHHSQVTPEALGRRYGLTAGDVERLQAQKEIVWDTPCGDAVQPNGRRKWIEHPFEVHESS